MTTRSPQGPQPGWAWRSSWGGGVTGHGLAQEDQTPGASSAHSWERAPLQVRTQLPPAVHESTTHRRGQGWKQHPESCRRQTPPTLTCPPAPPKLGGGGYPKSRLADISPGTERVRKQQTGTGCSPDKYPSPKKPTKSETR